MIRPHIVDQKTCPADGWGGMLWKTLISADRTPTCQITQGIAELAPAPPDTLLVHCHAHAETYFVLSGEGLLQIEDEQYPLAPGVAAFIPGGAHHTTWATGEEPLRILYTFAADSFGDVVYEFPTINLPKA